MAATSTARAALATVEAADAAASLAELPALVMPALMNLFGADSILWTELDATAAAGQAAATGWQPRRVIGYPEPLLTEESSLALERHASAFPLTCHTRPGGDGRPIRRSDLQSRRSFRGSGMYAEVARAIGVNESLAMALMPGSLHVCVSLNRAGHDFSAASVDLLTRLRPLLTRRVALLAAAETAAAPEAIPAAAGLTGRQLQVLDLVAAGLTDAAIGRRLGCSPRTVDKHLEHVYRRLGVSCRAAAVAAASCLAPATPAHLLGRKSATSGTAGPPPP
jgi:DNA-binding CsgD family transcriptional regulator